ncbi:hypothetical protein SDC9_60438 [bioreactor metagenome]|uniref:Uncharacterized protein n=1 Tax=bioreactor metagenome TaxID=1076179 RepID=A0A644XE79_9ZZZZ
MNTQEPFSHIYPSDEFELWQENQKLIDALKKSLISLASNEFENEYSQAINADGFYPYYTHQKVKILYIAKESLGLDGKDYIQAVFEGIQANDPRGHRKWNKCYPENPYTKVITNNSDPFLSKMLYLTYGLNNDCCSYEVMPWGSAIGQQLFGKQEGIIDDRTMPGISYAFMNFSKFDNPSEVSYAADMSRIQTYLQMVKRSKENWFAKQISLLNPDLIIEMNIGRENADNLGTGPIDWIERNNENLWVGYLPIENHKYLILETWHFSKPGKSFNTHFYPAIVDAWKRHGK